MANYITNGGPFTIPAQTLPLLIKGPKVYITGLSPLQNPIPLSTGHVQVVFCPTSTVAGWETAAPFTLQGPGYVIGLEVYSDLSGTSLIEDVPGVVMGWPTTGTGPFTNFGIGPIGLGPLTGTEAIRFYLAGVATTPALTISAVTINDTSCCATVRSYLPPNLAWSEMRTMAHPVWSWSPVNAPLPRLIGGGFVNTTTGAASVVIGPISGAGPWGATDIAPILGEQTMSTSVSLGSTDLSGATTARQGAHTFVDTSGLYHTYLSHADGTSVDLGGYGRSVDIQPDSLGRHPVVGMGNGNGGIALWQSEALVGGSEVPRVVIDEVGGPGFIPLSIEQGALNFPPPWDHVELLSGTRDQLPTFESILSEGGNTTSGLGQIQAVARNLATGVGPGPEPGQDMTIPYPASTIVALPSSNVFQDPSFSAGTGWLWHDSVSGTEKITMEWLTLDNEGNPSYSIAGVLGGLELPSIIGGAHTTNCGPGVIVATSLWGVDPVLRASPLGTRLADHYLVLRVSQDQHTIYMNPVTVCYEVQVGLRSDLIVALPSGFGAISAGPTSIWQSCPALFFGPMDAGWIPNGGMGVFMVIGATPDTRGPIGFTYAPSGSNYPVCAAGGPVTKAALQVFMIGA